MCLALPVTRARLCVCITAVRWVRSHCHALRGSTHRPVPPGAVALWCPQSSALLPILCRCWGLGQGAFGSPWQPSFSRVSPPQQRPGWVEQGFGVRGEEAESQNWPGLSWPCQPSGAGFLRLIAKLCVVRVGLTVAAASPARPRGVLLEGPVAGGLSEHTGCHHLCFCSQFLGSHGVLQRCSPGFQQDHV